MKTRTRRYLCDVASTTDEALPETIREIYVVKASDYDELLECHLQNLDLSAKRGLKIAEMQERIEELEIALAEASNPVYFLPGE